ncbi:MULTISPECIES: TadA family conjugal transfer-associated ATPase [Arthrobacter]|uniref:TadA family conjugal transfer-associated ATPase n=2 Tax=Arthrobacter TaxID=1663 RepID=A0ABU9KKZ2_9MICC|nr:TadA family conjugal transfer-associated ATPase [Arthrobacter sp. YJM1]MDP5227576.1 TadA family conjugal transfer-associated ATPase [Arthrobacter sp. YJM1]
MPAPGGGPAPQSMDPRILDSVRRDVLREKGPVTSQRVAAAVNSTGRFLGPAMALAAAESINAELRGLGPLQPLADDPGTTDIFVNGPEEVWVDRGAGLSRAEVALGGEEQLRALAQRLVASGGRRLDDGNPCVDVRLPGGYRVHAVIPPLSTRGTLLSLRIRRSRRFSLEEMASAGMFPTALIPVLRSLVSQRLNFLISGATGSGKTTLLSTLLGLVDPLERLVLVEDAAELDPGHVHVVGLEARHGNTEGRGVVDLRELVRQSLRMRPDRLVVGECRGSEVRELLTALNTGHSGAGTIHANSAADVPARLEALGALAGMSTDAVTAQAASALDAVLHVARTPDGRRLSEISMVDARQGRLRMAGALHLVGNRLDPGPAWDGLQRRLGLDGVPWS